MNAHNEQQARKLLALGLDEFGHHTEAYNVRNGIDRDVYKAELWAIRAALDAQPAAAPVSVTRDADGEIVMVKQGDTIIASTCHAGGKANAAPEIDYRSLIEKWRNSGNPDYGDCADDLEALIDASPKGEAAEPLHAHYCNAQPSSAECICGLGSPKGGSEAPTVYEPSRHEAAPYFDCGAAQWDTHTKGMTERGKRQLANMLAHHCLLARRDEFGWIVTRFDLIAEGRPWWHVSNDGFLTYDYDPKAKVLSAAARAGLAQAGDAEVQP